MCCVASGISDGLITYSEESYELCVCACPECDLETSTLRRLRPQLVCCATEEQNMNCGRVTGFLGKIAPPPLHACFETCSQTGQHARL
jgi:hypothetical protein